MGPHIKNVEKFNNDYKFKPWFKQFDYIKLSKRDLHSLDDPNWLNDDIIYVYIRKMSSGKATIFHSYIFKKIISVQNDFSQSCLLKNLDIFSKEDAIFIINVSNTHWSLMHMDSGKKTITYYDSLHFNGYEYLKKAEEFINYKLRSQGLPLVDYLLKDPKMCPKQPNAKDCGVYAILNAKLILHKQEICPDSYDNRLAKSMRILCKSELIE